MSLPAFPSYFIFISTGPVYNNAEEGGLVAE